MNYVDGDDLVGFVLEQKNTIEVALVALRANKIVDYYFALKGTVRHDTFSNDLLLFLRDHPEPDLAKKGVRNQVDLLMKISQSPLGLKHDHNFSEKYINELIRSADFFKHVEKYIENYKSLEETMKQDVTMKARMR